jgi:hypothetical protein
MRKAGRETVGSAALPDSVSPHGGLLAAFELTVPHE